MAVAAGNSAIKSCAGSVSSCIRYIRPSCAGCSSLFFFQAEDGIRYLTVTGVQTCALPICARVEAARTEVPVYAPGWIGRVALVGAYRRLGPHAVPAELRGEVDRKSVV